MRAHAERERQREAAEREAKSVSHALARVRAQHESSIADMRRSLNAIRRILRSRGYEL